MHVSRWPNFPNVTNTEALVRALRARKDLTAEHSAAIMHAYEIAKCLDDLENGRDVETGKLEILRLGRAYRDILQQLGMTQVTRAAKTPPKEKPAAGKAQAAHENGGGLTALDAFRVNHGVA